MTTLTATQLGYAATGRQLHLGLTFDGLKCAQGPAIVRVIAAVTEDSGRDGLIAALLAAGIKPTRLCGHCFPIVVRRAYAAEYTTRQQAPAVVLTDEYGNTAGTAEALEEFANPCDEPADAPDLTIREAFQQVMHSDHNARTSTVLALPEWIPPGLDLTDAVYYTANDGTVSALVDEMGFFVARGAAPESGWYWVHGITDAEIGKR